VTVGDRNASLIMRRGRGRSFRQAEPVVKKNALAKRARGLLNSAAHQIEIILSRIFPCRLPKKVRFHVRVDAILWRLLCARQNWSKQCRQGSGRAFGVQTWFRGFKWASSMSESEQFTGCARMDLEIRGLENQCEFARLALQPTISTNER